jgi:hypothetical protein
MHTRVHGGLYIYLHKMPGKRLGYGQMLGGEGFGWRLQYPEMCATHHAVEMDD